MIDTVTDIDLPILELSIIGFDDDHRFTLVRVDDAGVVCELRSLDHDDLSFVVVPPHVFFPEYSLEIEDEVVEALHIESGDNVQVLVLLTMGDTLATSTANLAAPVVLNLSNRRAKQVVLEQGGYDVRTALAAPR